MKSTPTCKAPTERKTLHHTPSGGTGITRGTRAKPPHGELARKHDVLTHKWTRWITQQWDPAPRGSKTQNPKETSTMPDEDLTFELTDGQEGEVSPYQPYPLTPHTHTYPASATAAREPGEELPRHALPPARRKERPSGPKGESDADQRRKQHHRDPGAV